MSNFTDFEKNQIFYRKCPVCGEKLTYIEPELPEHGAVLICEKCHKHVVDYPEYKKIREELSKR